MRMPRRPRRSGIKYIENNNSRSISFSKRRDGLFKIAANLSTLTGARIAIVMESENGKMSGFSAPSFGPIVDSFLSGEEGGAPEGPNEQEKDKIAELQSKLIQLEEDKAMQEQRAAESLTRVKEIQESSRLGKLIYSKVDDLCADELNELLCGLARIRQEIQALLPPHPPPPRVEINGSRGPPPPLQLSSPLHSQVLCPPRRLPWVSSQSQPSLPGLRSSCTIPQSSIRSQSFSLMSSPPMQPSSLQTISRMLLRQTQVSQCSSLLLRPQAPIVMPLPNNEAHHQHNYQSQGMATTGNTPGHFSQMSLLSSLPPPPLPTSALQIPSQRSVEVEIPFQALNLNPDVPLKNHANPHPSILENNEISHFFGHIGGSTPAHLFNGNQQQPSLIPCGANGGHRSPGCHKLPYSSGTYGNTYEWLNKTLLESSSQGGSSSDDGARDIPGDMDWFGDN